MKVKELYEFLQKYLEGGNISPETEVILTGEYNYGESVGKPYITNMNLIDETKIVKEDTRVVAISVDAYLYEHEDTGYSRMWVDNETLKDLINNDIIDCGDIEHES
jgi:hypothetical protein